MTWNQHLSFDLILFIGKEECYERKELHRIAIFQLSPVQ